MAEVSPLPLLTGIRIATSNPQQIGADRIVDAVAAYELYGGPVIVIDFGTATTYDMVDAEGTFMGGITAPGIRISAKALWEDTAKLPEIEIKKPDTILGKDTITSMHKSYHDKELRFPNILLPDQDAPSQPLRYCRR